MISQCSSSTNHNVTLTTLAHSDLTEESQCVSAGRGLVVALNSDVLGLSSGLYIIQNEMNRALGHLCAHIG